MLEFLTLLAILVALFGKDFVEWLKVPNLELSFDINDESFFHQIHFPIGFKHGSSEHYAMGFNCLFKVSNLQKRKFLPFIKTQYAKNVEVKITYIFEGNKKYTYHPTALNWSGNSSEDEDNTVSIASGSHHFLDFIRFYNYHNELWIDASGWIKSPINPTDRAISNIFPKERVYFEPWLPQKHGGIKKRFTVDSEYKIYLILNGENCGPYEYVVNLKWSKSYWDKPDIKIENPVPGVWQLKQKLHVLPESLISLDR